MPDPRPLSAKEELILRMLIREGPLYGLDMIERSEGKLKRGLIYIALSCMEDSGLVLSRYSQSADGYATCRRTYEATPFGRHCWRAQTGIEAEGV